MLLGLLVCSVGNWAEGSLEKGVLVRDNGPAGAGGGVSTVCLFLQKLLLARVALGRDPTTPTFHPLLGPAVHALGTGGALGQVGDSGTHLGGGWAITSAPLQRNGFTVAPKALPVSKGLSSCTLRKPRSGRARLAVISTGKPNAGGCSSVGLGGVQPTTS